MQHKVNTLWKRGFSGKWGVMMCRLIAGLEKDKSTYKPLLHLMPPFCPLHLFWAEQSEADGICFLLWKEKNMTQGEKTQRMSRSFLQFHLLKLYIFKNVHLTASNRPISCLLTGHMVIRWRMLAILCSFFSWCYLKFTNGCAWILQISWLHRQYVVLFQRWYVYVSSVL